MSIPHPQPPRKPASASQLAAAQEALFQRQRIAEVEPESLTEEMDRLERETPVATG